MARIVSTLKLLTVPTLFSGILTAATQTDSIMVNLPDGDAPFTRFNRAFACYISDAISGLHNDRCIYADRIAITNQRLPQLAGEQLSESIDPKTRQFDTNKLKEWWGVWSYALRDLNHQIIAPDLATFIKNTSFTSWPSEIVAPSQIKGKTRIIYRSPESFMRSISVAQTLDTATNDPSAPVLETEVGIERDDQSGNADFYSYNAEGILATMADFPSGEKPVPTVCLSCHYSPDRAVFTRFH